MMIIRRPTQPAGALLCLEKSCSLFSGLLATNHDHKMLGVPTRQDVRIGVMRCPAMFCHFPTASPTA